MMFLIGMISGGLIMLLLKVVVKRIVRWKESRNRSYMKIIRAINPEMKVVSGSNNCNGEWKNDCPYMVCECAKKEAIEMDEDYRQEYHSIFGSVVFWIVAIVLIVVGLLTAHR